MPRPEVQESRRRGRFTLVRRSPVVASPKVLRRRDMRVLNLGLWLLVYTPREHWSDYL